MAGAPVAADDESTFAGMYEGFEVQLNLDAGKQSLLFELSNPRALSIYRAEFANPEEIRAKTEQFLTSPAELFHMFKGDLQPHPTGNLSFDQRGPSLIHTWTPFTKTMVWTFPLQHVIPNADERFTVFVRKVDRLCNSVQDVSTRVEALSTRVDELGAQQRYQPMYPHVSHIQHGKSTEHGVQCGREATDETGAERVGGGVGRAPIFSSGRATILRGH